MKKRVNKRYSIETKTTPGELFQRTSWGVVGPPPTTPEEFRAQFECFAKYHNRHFLPIYDEAGILREISEISRAVKLRPENPEAMAVLQESELLLRFLRNGKIHAAVYSAMLMMQKWMYFLMRPHEANVATGRKHRARAHEGQIAGLAVRIAKLSERNQEIVADHHKGYNVVRLSKKYTLSKSQIHRILPKK